MKKSVNNYFTTGELAKLCKIPRKTLLYYDSLGLIFPEVIDENGYRYYKRTQLFTLELILTMRKLDIPLAEIKNYLTNKSYDHYKELLCQREDILEQLILKLTNIKNELHRSILQLKQLPKIRFNEISTVHNNEEFLFLSDPIPPNLNFKDRTRVSADLFMQLATQIPLSNHTFGYIVEQSILADIKTPRYIKYYFYPLFGHLKHPNCTSKPEGTYLTLYFKGLYMDNYDKQLNLLFTYLNTNKITPLSDLYITSIQNFWLTDEINEYIYKLEVKIK